MAGFLFLAFTPQPVPKVKGKGNIQYGLEKNANIEEFLESTENK